MIYAAIIGAEIGFWVFIALGLLSRYILKKPKLGVFFLICTPLTDLFLLAVAGYDLAAGTGKAEFHHAVAALEGTPAEELSPEAIAARGRSGECRLCREALDIFCAALGTAAGNLALTFGAAFELPILILALAALGLVTPQFLTRFRPYALVLTFVVSAFVTPGDILLASLALTAPLYLLYELSVLLTRLVFRKRNQAILAEQNAAGGLA